MKKTALLMTVGTGVGEDKEKRVESLSHGLLTSILHYYPEKIVFFGSEESKETVESLKNQYKEKTKEELTHYDFISLTKIDDFEECFGQIRSVVEKYNAIYEIVIDYTSGTKTMTNAASICSLLYHKKLSLVSGKRGNNGIVIPGTERVQEQNLYSAYDKYLFDKFKELFNSYQFKEARDVLDEIVILNEKEKYRDLVDGYDLWDKFSHKNACEKLREVRDERINNNKAFLGRLNNEMDKIKVNYIFVDLINNAKRRISEGKYDDAVARLYRAFELIAQIKLKEYGLNDLSEKKFTIDDLKEKGIDIEKYKNCVDEKGKLKLGLKKKFKLLKDLGWAEADKVYLENKNIKDLLTNRNNSILAHGLHPIDKETAENLFSEVENIGKELIENFEELKKEAIFPKL